MPIQFDDTSEKKQVLPERRFVNLPSVGLERVLNAKCEYCSTQEADSEWALERRPMRSGEAVQAMRVVPWPPQAKVKVQRMLRSQRVSNDVRC